MQRFKKINTILIFLLLFCSFLALPMSYAAENGTPCGTPSNAAPTEPASVVDGIERIELHCVENGEIKNRAFTGKELAAETGLQVDGYVYGVTVFCSDDLDVSIDNKTLKKVSRGNDAPTRAHVSDANASYVCSDSAGCYTLFSTVPGDALSHQPNLNLAFKGPIGVYTMDVRQQPSCSVPGCCADPDCTRSEREFICLGSTLERMRERTADFDARLKAISAGIDLVESVAGDTLVDRVKIVDLDNPRGAAARDGSSDIWLYANAFLDESIDELSAISSHEALHILVGKYGLARDSEVRELFASLWGYDEFSRERFCIVSGGVVPSADPRQAPLNGAFFAFINERNFLDDMKGGHSHESLEEFCVSLLHSLLYSDRLEENLGRLSTDERERIKESYLGAVETLVQALPRRDKESLPLKTFIGDRLRSGRDQIAGKDLPPA